MISILETIALLFGTAFILGFLTYGLKNVLNPVQSETQPSATEPPVVKS